MDYTNYIKPELLVLVPVLYIIGAMIKNTAKVKDNYIPIILGFVGVVLSCLYVFAMSGISIIGVFTAITQGVLVAGVSVYTNQLVKQISKTE